MLNTLSSVSVRESRIQYLCDPQWFRDTASRGPTTIVAPESQLRTFPTDHGTTSQSASHNVALNQNSKGTAQVTEANQLPPAIEITAGEHPNLNPKAETIGRTNGFYSMKKSATSKSSPRSFHSFKWETIKRESLKDSSATKIAQIIGGERRQWTEYKICQQQRLRGFQQRALRNFKTATFCEVSRFADVCEATSFYLVETLRFDVTSGTSCKDMLRCERNPVAGFGRPAVDI
ncbi:scarecrow-like protein 33 [Dorcoceras hygrometricum]|uniref:Scarecrow-like protein 33 n=1 Tax=Dorcoceras hygrometricum TaxID=472368 RepID=A0A2Z7AE26_9LAMI|nr:scarecrow-like protein 33 [Dorcoceras hygrometricum]